MLKNRYASKNRYVLYPPNTDLAKKLVDMINPYSQIISTSNAALTLIDKIEPEQLNTPCELVKKMGFVECELEYIVPHTIGTQCLIYLFDPGNGWIRDCCKRGDMLLMIAKLVEKGVSLEGLYYYRGSAVIKDQSFKQIVQGLINEKEKPYPPAKLSSEVKEIFTNARYNFSYPSDGNEQSLTGINFSK